MIPCAEIVSRASIINTWKILGDYQVFVENTRESLLTLGSVADSSSEWRQPTLKMHFQGELVAIVTPLHL